MRGTDRAAGLSLDPVRLTLSGLSLGLLGKQFAAGRCAYSGFRAAPARKAHCLQRPRDALRRCFVSVCCQKKGLG
jgi:hypothetical protein